MVGNARTHATAASRPLIAAVLAGETRTSSANVSPHVCQSAARTARAYLSICALTARTSPGDSMRAPPDADVERIECPSDETAVLNGDLSVGTCRSIRCHAANLKRALRSWTHRSRT